MPAMKPCGKGIELTLVYRTVNHRVTRVRNTGETLARLPQTQSICHPGAHVCGSGQHAGVDCEYCGLRRFHQRFGIGWW
jgi:hypothetical protein